MSVINENTEITINKENNTITFANQGKNGDIYINTFVFQEKKKELEKDKEKEE